MNQIFSFDYRNSDHPAEYDASQAIVYARKRLKKNDKPLLTVRAVHTRRIVIGAILMVLPAVLGYLEGTLMGLSHFGYFDLWLLPESFHLLVSVGAGSGVGLLFLGIMGIVRHNREMNKRAKLPHGVGQLIFDEIGICDLEAEGTVVKYPWKRYECCVITPQVIVLFFDAAIMFVVAGSPEADWNVTQALTAYGKAGTIYRRRIR